MTYLLASILAAAVGTTALLAGFSFWITRRAFKATDATLEASAAVLELSTTNEKLQGGVVRAAVLVADLEDERDREIAARKLAEEILHDAVAHLAADCPPEVIADAINLDLARLREMSEAGGVPKVPAGDDGRGPRAVHGTIAAEDS